MSNILHRLGMKAPIQDVFTAIATVEGVAQWWTRETEGECALGKTFEVRFISPDGNLLGRMEIEVVELVTNERVRWSIRSGPDEWMGTDVVFDLKVVDDFTIILFRHIDWREEVEFMAHCSMKWATFLLSLKSYIESGKGMPSPDDTKVDNWN